MRDLIVVGSNPKLTLQVLLSAHSHSRTKSIVIGDSLCRPIGRSTLCERFHSVELGGAQDERFVTIVNQLASEHPGALLVPADCEGIHLLHRTAARLIVGGIPYPAPATLDMLNDKWSFYQFCIANGLRTPETIFIGDKGDLNFDEAASRLGLPFILKPTNQAGGEGVHIIYDEIYYLSQILNNANYQFSPLVAQRFVPGADGGLSVFSLRGQLCALAIQKYVRGGVRFVENEYLEKIAADICRLCEFHGVMNLDVRMEDGGEVYFTEANPRFWATTFAAVWAGLNFVAESVEAIGPQENIKKLTDGTFHHRRHPLIRPEAWPYLVLDRGQRGRMARAMTFDLYVLPQFIGSLPTRTANYAKRHFRKGPETRPNESPPVA
ncbi:MAG: ATP-grasp protein [Herminiimonas sp.]|nr:ATP-grasp protein [Herminiimonas sp.]MDB5852721.1 ATP-grasp protein [Herminiimonas sp.]